jgi:tryptophan-rich sensory protein
MILPILGASAVAAVVLFVGGFATRIGPWYYELRKPSWNPPNWVFGPMWTGIAILAVWSASHAWVVAPDAHTRIVALFGINAVFHMAWSPLFFALRRPDWALLEVPFLWLSVLALIVGLAPLSMLSAALLTPYLAWVGVAAFLNLTIVRLNPPFGGTRAA